MHFCPGNVIHCETTRSVAALRFAIRKRSRFLACFARQLFVRDPLAHYAGDGQTEALAIGQLSVVESVGLFIQVAKQMERFDTHVGTVNAALQETPEILKAIL
jgi:hypothetical protein